MFSIIDNDRATNDDTVGESNVFESPLVEFYNVFYNLAVPEKNITTSTTTATSTSTTTTTTTNSDSDNNISNNSNKNITNRIEINANNDVSCDTDDTDDTDVNGDIGTNEFENTTDLSSGIYGNIGSSSVKANNSSINDIIPPLVTSPSQQDIKGNSIIEKENNEDLVPRDWHQYNIDIRMFKFSSKNDLISIIILFGCSLFIVFPISQMPYCGNGDILLFLIFFNVLFPFLFQRKYDVLIFVSILSIYLSILLKIVNNLILLGNTNPT
jgi:hypothetical protein